MATETLTVEINITAPGEIRTYLKAFAELSRTALYAADARSCIDKAIYQLS
ncbi:hypothetical protein [Streptomyces sp. NPDC002994]|uniref:hypothetical protein n=1 Tax=Streptomyces sp. NPDC002994 TaxID=3154441 RepID=UPI0033BC8E9A